MHLRSVLGNNNTDGLVGCLLSDDAFDWTYSVLNTNLLSSNPNQSAAASQTHGDSPVIDSVPHTCQACIKLVTGCI